MDDCACRRVGVVIEMTVREDEPVYWLQEGTGKSPDSRSWRRYQTIGIVRNDEIVAWTQDMGPADEFTVGPINFPFLGGDETVGTIKYMADQYREQLMLRDPMEEFETTQGDWEQFYFDERNRRILEASGKGVFGPHFRKMR